MKKVYIIEYQGRCDENSQAVGHAPKVITEYYDFIKDFSDVSVYAPKTIFKSIKQNSFEKIKVLPHHILMKGKTPFIEKITNKLNMFSNISKAIQLADKDGQGILWFFNVEYYIMLYLAFHKKPKHKIYMTMFIDGYFAGENASLKSKIVNGVKQYIFEKAQKKIDLIISTGEKFSYKNCKNFYIPDYYYIPALYDRYKIPFDEKSDSAVCLGTMGRSKQLKEMIEAFNRIGYKLHIAGRFYDKELLSELKSLANENITIDDTYLSNDEYMNLLAKARFTVLPYPKENYSHQTSGVMQEAIFVNTIPVTYTDILTGNCVNGIGFKNWDSLSKEMLDIDCSTIVDSYNESINTKYSEESVKKSYKRLFI